MFLTLCCSEKAAPPVTGPTVSLPAVELEAFGALPAVKPAAVTPALQEQPVTLDKAINYKQVMAFLEVRLTPGQQKFLNETPVPAPSQKCYSFPRAGDPRGRGTTVMMRCWGCLTR